MLLLLLGGNKTDLRGGNTGGFGLEGRGGLKSVNEEGEDNDEGVGVELTTEGEEGIGGIG